MAVNLPVVTDVGADEVPACVEVIHRLVDGDGVVAGGLAVGVDVADGDGLAGAAQVAGREADGDIIVGHVERRAAARGAARDAVVAVLVAEGRFAAAVGERQAHGVAAAGVEHLVIYQSFDEGVAVAAGARGLVGGDAADAVLRGRSVVADADALARRDAAALLALGGVVLAVVEVAGVVAVGDFGDAANFVAAEGGAIRCAYADAGGGEERVADVERSAVPAHEAAAVGGSIFAGAGAEQAAGEGAALDVEGLAAHRDADESAVGAVAAGAAVDVDAAQAVAHGDVACCAADESGGVLVAGVDGDAAGAVLDGERAPAGADDAAGVVLGGGDGAGNVKVADGGRAIVCVAGVGLGGADVAERGGVVVVAVAADVDGQRVAPAVEGAAEVVAVLARHAGNGVLRRANVASQLHGLAAEAVVGAVVVEGVAEHVPARGGVDGVLGAGGVDGEVRRVGRPFDRYHRVIVGHGERRAAERARADGVAVFVHIARGHVGGVVGERQAHGVVIAVVERRAVVGGEPAAAVGGDAAEVVGRRVAGEGDGLDADVRARRDGVRLLALGRAERPGVVAVGDVGDAVRAAAHEGGALRGAYPRLAVSGGGGGVEGVLDCDGGSAAVVAVAHEAGAVVGGLCASGEQLAVEEAALDGERGVLLAHGHEAAVGAVAVVAAEVAADGDAAVAVLDGGGAVLVGDESGGVLGRGLDGAADAEVLNLSADHVEEGGGIVLGGAVVDGQRLAPAVERAGEVVAARARHAGDGDVVAELHGLAAEAVVGRVVLQGVAEHVPARGGVDGVLVAALREVGRVGSPCSRDADVLFGHGERGAVDGRAIDGVGVEDVAVGGSGRAAKGDGGAAGVVVIAAEADSGRAGGSDALAEGQLIDALVAAAGVGAIAADGQAVGVVVGATLDGEGCI